MHADKLSRGRPGLVGARKRKGWSQATAAERTGVSTTTWSRWESGDQEIRAGNRQRIANAFDVSIDEVDRWADGEQCEPLPWHTPGMDQPTLEATLGRTSELWRWDVDHSRRRFLSSLPFVPGFLSEWLLSWQFEPGVASRAHQGSDRAVGLEDVRRMREAIDTFAMMDHLFGGGYVRPTIVDFLHHQLEPLLHGTYSDEVGSQLLTAAAIMTGMAGWEAYDLSMHGLAQGHYGQALQLSKAAGDPLVSAWVLTVMAQQAIDLKLPDWAIRLARAARQAGEQAGAPPRVLAGLLLREARATGLRVQLANTRDGHARSRTEKLLFEVETAYAKARADDVEPWWWVDDLDQPEIMAEAGCAWKMIGNSRQAVECADSALAGFDKEHPRSIQFNRIHRGQALLQMGEMEAAISSARDGLSMSGALTSRRSAALIREFDLELDPHSSQRSVIEWREYRKTELPRGFRTNE